MHQHPYEGKFANHFVTLPSVEQLRFEELLRTRLDLDPKATDGEMALVLFSKLTNWADDIRALSAVALNTSLHSAFSHMSSTVYCFNAQLDSPREARKCSRDIWKRHLLELWFPGSDDWVLVGDDLSGAVAITHYGTLLAGELSGGADQSRRDPKRSCNDR